MCLGEKVMESFIPWLREWIFYVVDLVGFPRGLLSASSPNFKSISLVISQSGIVMDVEDYTLESSSRIINIYRPYIDS
jgi:hypothetical protein